MKGENKGFTIIEVVLFLAVSAALFTIAFRYMGSTIKTTQFTDVTKSFESFLERQYTRAQTGAVTANLSLNPTSRLTCPTDNSYVITSTTVTGTQNKGFSDSCIVVGVMINIVATSPASASVYPVLASANGSQTGSDETILSNSRPVVWGLMLIDRFSFPLGYQPTTMVQAWSGLGATDTNVFEKIAFLKSPTSATMRTYVFTDTAWSTALSSKSMLGEFVLDAATFHQQNTSVHPRRNARALLCITADNSTGLRGAIELNGNGGTGGFSIDSITSGIYPVSTVFSPNYLTPPASVNYSGLRCT